MTLVLWPLCSLTQSLMEKEQKLLILQEAESVHQQELNSLRQDVQEARGEGRELSAQVLNHTARGPRSSAEACSWSGEASCLGPSHEEDRSLVPYYRMCWDCSSPGRRGTSGLGRVGANLTQS